MKFLIYVMTILTLTNYQVHAADKSSGCGLGKMIAPRKSLVSTSTAATTDGFSWHTRSSAMTSGTSGCAEHSLVKSEHRKEHFISTNINSLKYESALGAGEHLLALADIYGCPSTSFTQFSHTMKSHYKDIFGAETDPLIIQGSIGNYLTQNNSLSGCVL